MTKRKLKAKPKLTDPSDQKTTEQTTVKRSPPPEVEVVPSHCPKCQSTKRTGYNAVKEREIRGETRDGRKYQRIQWKRTKCEDCGQHRVDVFYLNSKARKK